MAHGSYDPMIPMARAQHSRDALQALGYPVEWREYPMPHSVCPQEIADIAEFLRILWSRHGQDSLTSSLNRAIS